MAKQPRTIVIFLVIIALVVLGIAAIISWSADIPLQRAWAAVLGGVLLLLGIGVMLRSFRLLRGTARPLPGAGTSPGGQFLIGLGLSLGAFREWIQQFKWFGDEVGGVLVSLAAFWFMLIIAGLLVEKGDSQAPKETSIRTI